MKAKVSISIFFLFVFVVCVHASEQAPILVSPGSDVGIALVGEVCPTFSWTAVEGSAAYRVEVFNAIDNMQLIHEEMAAMSYPVLTKEILGAATSWTPSSDQRLSHDGIYVWYVQAIDAYGQGTWSKGKIFHVGVNFGFGAIKKKMSETLQKYGASEDVITNVLEEIRNETIGIITGGTDRIDSEKNRGGIRISGYEGTNNTFYGINAGTNTTGYYNSFFGADAGLTNTTGYGNIFLGWRAGFNNTSGYLNTLLGYLAGDSNTTGTDNTFVGSIAGWKNTIGYENTFIGLRAGQENTEGFLNTFLGAGAGNDNTTGDKNTFLGNGSGDISTTGNENTFLGWRSGWNFTTGSNNTFLGGRAGYNNSTGHGNIFLGNEAGSNETSSNKLYIDNSDTSDPLIYGDFGNDIVSFMGTVGVGTKTPAFPMEMKKTGTNASIVVDRTDGATNYINATATSGNFGTVTPHVLRLVVGSQWKMRLHTDNSLTFRNGASCTSGGVWTNASSRDLKDDINELTTDQALDALNDLRPVTYNYKADVEDEHVGFIAEDVPDLVASKDRKGMSPMDVVAVLTKVLQEQQNINEELRVEIAKLRAKLNQDR